MKEIGELLRLEREKKELSIKEVAAATKINAKAIQAIEEANLAALPSKPFLRGFIQSYARHLGMNVDEIMRLFLEEHGTTKAAADNSEIPNIEKPNTTKIVMSKWSILGKAGTIIGAVVFLIIIYFVQKTIDKYEAESLEANEQKKSINTSPKKKKLADSPIAKLNAPIPIKEEPKAKPIGSEKPSSKKNQSAQKEEPKVNTDEVKKEKPVAVSTSSQPQEIIIEALDSVKIVYYSDGKGPKTQNLKPEQVLTIKAKKNVKLTLSDSGAINIIHNGTDKGVPGNLGEPLDMSFPK